MARSRKRAELRVARNPNDSATVNALKGIVKGMTRRAGKNKLN